MRMHAGGGKQPSGVRAGQTQRRTTAGHIGAGDDDLSDAMARSPLNDRLAVVIEAGVSQIGADVYPLHAQIMRLSLL